MEAGSQNWVSKCVARVCRECHVELAPESGLTACPACGGALVAAHGEVEGAGLPPRSADRRGVLLPRRHAVGGIITPR